MQQTQKLNVWVGILGNSVIGFFFIDSNLTGVKYLDMLRNSIVPAIIEVVLGNYKPVFQQHDAPPHYNVLIRIFLDQTFPERWIG